MVVEVLAFLLVLLPAVLATIFQWNAWPFQCYPMFSNPFHPEGLRVFRIAYQNRQGALIWWKPRYHRLAETLGQEAEACFDSPPLCNKKRVDGLFTRIAGSLAVDPSATDVLSICVMVRRCQRDESTGCWRIDDTVAARRLITARAETAQ